MCGVSPLQAGKAWIVGASGLPKDALHVYVGLAVFLGSAALFRWPLRSWRPFLLVVAAALAGEAWDLRDSVRYDTPVLLSRNWHDVWNTVLWPGVILLLARTGRLRA